MNKNYKAQLKDGREIYIPRWSVSVQYENLVQACKHLGQDDVIKISTNVNVPATMLAIMGSDDAEATTSMVLHFTQQARIDDKKVMGEVVEELGMATIVELFSHVMYSQYSDFFVSGLVKAPSQPQ